MMRIPKGASEEMKAALGDIHREIQRLGKPNPSLATTDYVRRSMNLMQSVLDELGARIAKLEES